MKTSVQVNYCTGVQIAFKFLEKMNFLLIFAGDFR